MKKKYPSLSMAKINAAIYLDDFWDHMQDQS